MDGWGLLFGLFAHENRAYEALRAAPYSGVVGYIVETSGRIRLSEQAEREALTVLEVQLPSHQGWFDGQDLDTLDDLGSFVGVSLQRHGDDVLLATDDDGDPKWSEQATAFYRGLARWVTDGAVHFRGEDGETWSYLYTPDGLRQIGTNGWDGSSGEPGGAPADRAVTDTPRAPGASSPPSDTGPGRTDRISYPPAPGAGPAVPPGRPVPPAGPPPPTYGAPGQSTPPPYPGPGPYDATPGGGTPGAPWTPDPAAWQDHPPRPRNPARTAGMVVLLIVGVILIIGIASLGAGLAG